MSIKMRVTAAVLAASTLGGVLWFHHRADAGTTPSYRLGKVERGSVKSTVSATGTLGAVRTVEVGTQVSGQIAALYVDFNSHVKKGQLIARIDPILQEAGGAGRAGRAREAPSAVATQTQLDYDRSKKLHDQQIATDAEFNVAQSSYAQAKASLTSAQINLAAREAEPRLHEHLLADRRRRRRAQRWTSARPSRRACRRRSCSSSRTTCRGCRSSPRSTRATSARSRRASRSRSPCSRSPSGSSPARSSRCASTRRR